MSTVRANAPLDRRTGSGGTRTAQHVTHATQRATVPALTFQEVCFTQHTGTGGFESASHVTRDACQNVRVSQREASPREHTVLRRGF